MTSGHLCVLMSIDHMFEECARLVHSPTVVLVTSKRKSGDVNYSEAISFGMPKGRGRKGEAPPRKRNKRKSGQPSVTVQRIQARAQEDMPQGRADIPPQFQQPTPPSAQAGPSAQFLLPPSSQPPPQHRLLVGNRPHMANTGLTQQQTPLGPQQQMLPPYPSPAPNTFILYSFHFCPPLMSVCFGCGSSLKPSGLISDPPGELVIVSKMLREWIHDGQVFRKPATLLSLFCGMRPK